MATSKELHFNCCLGQMFVSDVSDFLFVGKVEPYFLSAGEELNNYYQSSSSSLFLRGCDALTKIAIKV